MMSAGTLVGLAAVGLAGGGALGRALRAPRRLAARADLGALQATLRGRLWVVLNPAVRIDLYERGLVLTPTILPRLVVRKSELTEISRVKDARRSGRRTAPGSRLELEGPRNIAVELSDDDHGRLLDWRG